MTLSKPPITLAELSAAMDELKKQAKENGALLFKDAIQEYFTLHPIAEEISFVGYSPFFNDGDECVFGIHDYYTRVNGQGEESDECEIDALSEELWTGWNSATNQPNPKKANPDYDPALSAAYKDLNKILRMVPDETFQMMFGNHFRVVATPERVDVDEFIDHD